MKSDLVDVTVQVHATTDRAILVSDDGEREKAIWLPLSQCEVLTRPNGIAVVTLPEWLALQRGLI